MLRNISDLKTIEFDFNNIDLIGPAFADELVRKTKLKIITLILNGLTAIKLLMF